MKWTIDSITHNQDPTVIVRIAITRDDGTVFYDQNCIADTATDEEIKALCDAMCDRHEPKPAARRDLSRLVGVSNAKRP